MIVDKSYPQHFNIISLKTITPKYKFVKYA